VKPTGKARLMVCLIAVGLRLAAPGQARANVEPLLAEINRRPPERRLKALTDGARKEGVIFIFALRRMLRERSYNRSVGYVTSFSVPPFTTID